MDRVELRPAEEFQDEEAREEAPQWPPLEEQIRQLHEEGLSVRGIASALSAEGRPVSKSRVHRVLKKLRREEARSAPAREPSRLVDSRLVDDEGLALLEREAESLLPRPSARLLDTEGRRAYGEATEAELELRKREFQELARMREEARLSRQREAEHLARRDASEAEVDAIKAQIQSLTLQKRLEGPSPELQAQLQDLQQQLVEAREAARVAEERRREERMEARFASLEAALRERAANESIGRSQWDFWSRTVDQGIPILGGELRGLRDVLRDAMRFALGGSRAGQTPQLAPMTPEEASTVAAFITGEEKLHTGQALTQEEQEALSRAARGGAQTPQRPGAMVVEEHVVPVFRRRVRCQGCGTVSNLDLLRVKQEGARYGRCPGCGFMMDFSGLLVEEAQMSQPSAEAPKRREPPQDGVTFYPMHPAPGE